MSNFALIGAAGYIAPRHMRAISATGNQLVAIMDPSDSVGIVDTFSPDAAYFREFERFDRHVDMLRRTKDVRQIDYVSICSPNYLHDSHIRFALRSQSSVICEKPLVLNPWNIDALHDIEGDSGRKINTILQLRLHPEIISLRNRALEESYNTKHDVDLTYVTARGKWYLQSWKGDDKKSGGIATNIGVHFFDMLQHVFGSLQTSQVHHNSPVTSAGYIEYERARVRWFLSIDPNNLPADVRKEGQRTYRSITCDDHEIEFSGGFSDLHTRSYEEIVAGRGFGLEENRAAIETVASIRTVAPIGLTGDYHPFLRRIET